MARKRRQRGREGELEKEKGTRGRGAKPTVALPPILISPKRENGTERVVIPGTTSRITITSSGFEGMSFEDMLSVCTYVG